jgi:regulatory protein
MQEFEAKEKKPVKITDPHKGLLKAQKYCVYQERCQQEMRDKLYEWGLWKDAIEKIISDLITENFLNEERFSKAFAGGKFRIKKWGRVKIRQELKKRNITDYCIKKGLLEIDPDDYQKTLQKIITDKGISADDTLAARKINYKSAQYAISRGFESELVWEIINEKKRKPSKRTSSKV